jgi:hypothetical protein
MYSTPSNLKMNRKYKKFVEAGEYRPHSRDIKYITYKELQDMVIQNNIKNIKAYKIWQKENRDKIIMPANPDVVYNEWINWNNFLRKVEVSV